MSETESNPTPRRGLKKRALVLFLAFLGAVGLVIWITGTFKREPLHKGRPISYWIDQPRQHSEVKEIGQVAVPYLVARLRTRDTWWRTGWNKFHRLLPAQLRHKLPSYEPAANAQFIAAKYLEVLGPDAKSAATELAKLATVSKSSFSGIAALHALTAMGTAAAPALPQLRANWRLLDPFPQVETARTLWAIGRETNLVLEIFTNSLLSGGPYALNGAFGLGEMGSAARPAVPMLVSLLRDETGDATLRGNSAGALGRIGVVNEEIISILLIAIQDPDSHVRGNSAIALWQLNSGYLEVAVPKVVEFAVDLVWDSFVKFAHSHQLDLKPALPTMRGLLENESAQVRKFAAEALNALGVSAEKNSDDTK